MPVNFSDANFVDEVFYGELKTSFHLQRIN